MSSPLAGDVYDRSGASASLPRRRVDDADPSEPAGFFDAVRRFIFSPRGGAVAATLIGAAGLASAASPATAATASEISVPATADRIEAFTAASTHGGASITRAEMARGLADLVASGVTPSEIALVHGWRNLPEVTPGARDLATDFLVRNNAFDRDPGPTIVSSHNFSVTSRAHLKGAYFRKVESPTRADYRGISGVAVLPTTSFDSARNYDNPDAPIWKHGPLERPSVYMGGNAAGHEVDVGLSWGRVHDSDGRVTFTDLGPSSGRDPAHVFVKDTHGGEPVLIDGNGKVVAEGAAAVSAKSKDLTPNFAFRPFWRTTNDGGNQWAQPTVGSAEDIYFYPGEHVRMQLVEAGKNSLRLDLSVEGGPAFTKTFRQQGFGIGKAATYKRVTSIDQFYVKANGERKGREGLAVEATRTKALGGGWESVHILRKNAAPLPMTGKAFREIRGGDTSPRYGSIFEIWGRNANGGERVDIIPRQP